MKRLAVFCALAVASTFAFASNCPNEMKEIDAAMPKAKLSAAEKTQVQKLRAEGEAHHKAGRHKESMEALTKAKSIMGLK